MKKSLFILLCLIYFNSFGQYSKEYKQKQTKLVSYNLTQKTPSTLEDPKVYIGIVAVGGTFLVNRYVCTNMTEGQQMLVAISGAATLFLTYTIIDAVRDHKYKNRYKKCVHRI